MRDGHVDGSFCISFFFFFDGVSGVSRDTFLWLLEEGTCFPPPLPGARQKAVRGDQLCDCARVRV